METGLQVGGTLTFRVIIHRGKEQPVYWCESPDLTGLVAEKTTIEELIKEVNIIAEELLDLNYNLKTRLMKRVNPQLVKESIIRS